MGSPFGPPFGFKGLRTERFTYSKNMNQIIKPLSSSNQKMRFNLRHVTLIQVQPRENLHWICKHNVKFFKNILFGFMYPTVRFQTETRQKNLCISHRWLVTFGNLQCHLSQFLSQQRIISLLVKNLVSPNPLINNVLSLHAGIISKSFRYLWKRKNEKCTIFTLIEKNWAKISFW